MIKILFSLLLLVTQTQALAEDVKALFHPYDDNLNHISQVFEKAQTSIDMALYNIDSASSNPVIAWISSNQVQARIRAGDLKIRLIFEGYESPDAVEKKMLELEGLGVDVRTLGRAQKMHHKFAVIDGYSFHPILITGSANWSLMSQRQFNENTLFFENHQGLSQQFQTQFEVLWSHSQEIGRHVIYNYGTLPQIHDSQDGANVYFNTDNYIISENGFQKKPADQGYVLTKQIVAAIDQAQSHIEIATTRIKLRPIYNAILRAAGRGVSIKIVVTMQSYQYEYQRRQALMRQCIDEYQRKCSTSQDFALLLERNEYPGKQNVEVRIKHFHVSKNAYLNKQMHSKYMLVDGKSLLTGSFNWSYSAEYGHIENLVVLSGVHYPEALEEFSEDFHYLWNLGRENYQGVIKRFETAVSVGAKTNCSYEPMTLTYSEIDYLLNSGQRAGGSLAKSCK